MRRSASGRLAISVAALALAAVASGCLGAARERPLDKTYFVLAPPRSEPPATDGSGVLRIERLRVNPLFERKGFTYRTGADTFENDFYNQFFVPPGTVLQSALIGWFQASGRFARVGGSDALDADWVLGGSVPELYVDVRDRAAPRAVVALETRLVDARAPALPVVAEKRYAAEEAVAGDSGQAVVDAWSRALARIAAELETDLAVARAARAPKATR